MKQIAQENIVELVKLGHERAAELKASCGAVDVRSLAQLISDLATQLEVQLVRGNAQSVQLANAESKCRELAAESSNKSRCLGFFASVIKSGEEWTSVCEHEYFEAFKTPETDAFLAEVRASAIPEGYVLVPQQIFLEPSDIESICSQCGDGHESGYGDFTDGLLWVGNIQRDDGSIVHGLHISSADYTEEGGVTVCEFAAQLRKGAAL